jgi:hypothetical protein
MPIQSLSSARVQDPVLTNVIHGTRQPQFIGTRLLPLVPVALRSGKVIKFGKEDFALYNTRRAPGGRILRTQSQYGDTAYSLYQDSIAEEVPVELFEEALIGAAKVNLRNGAPKKALRKVSLRLEKDIADKVQDPSLYETNNTIALSGSDRWDDYAGSNPTQAIRAWKEAIRSQTGVYPNVAQIGPLVFNAVADHPVILEKIKYTSADSVTAKLLAGLWELDEVLVGQSVALNSAGTLGDIWGKTVTLAYVPGKRSTLPVAEESAMKEEPAFGYTYQLQNYPIALPERLDEDVNSYVYTVMAEREPHLVGMGNTGKIGAGFLATSVIS